MDRLLCLISSMNAGGAETFLMKLYRNLDKEKYQMDFCVNIKNNGIYDNEIKEMGGKIYHIPSKTKNPYLFYKDLFYIIKDQYKYVMRIGANSFCFWDLKIAKKAGAKICIARSSNSSDGNKIISEKINIAGRNLFLKYVDIMIAPSDLAAEYTFGKKNVRDGKVNFIKNGLDLEKYSFDQKARERIREEFNLKNKYVIGHIGRFTKQKNHDYLLEVFRELIKIRNNCVLLLVGEGELLASIKNKVLQQGLMDRVIFTGVRTDIPDILSAMDVLLFPSLYEGMPNVVIEAQANGLPCVISDSITKEVGITELVHFCSLNAEPEKWAFSILQIGDKKIRECGVSVMRERGYDIRDVVKRFEKLIWGKETE